MLRYCRNVLFAILLLVAHSAGSAESGEKQSPIQGSGAHFSWVMFDALEQQLEQKSGREIELSGRKSMLGMGCKAGINKAKENRPGNETFGLVCCELSKERLAKEGLILHPIAREPILILVNKSNPVRNLSVKQVRQLFSGKLTNWKQVGGRDQPVVVVTRLHCRDKPGHWKTILPTAEDFRQQRVNVKSAVDMITRVSDFSGAIGHTGSTWKFTSDHRVKAISVSGVKASTANMKKGKYPFHRQLGVVTYGPISNDLNIIIKETQEGNGLKKLAIKYGLQPLY
jgi:phosphate transport system substrate-binding protein